MKLAGLNSSALIRAQIGDAPFVAQMGLEPNFLPYEASAIVIHGSRDLSEH